MVIGLRAQNLQTQTLPRVSRGRLRQQFPLTFFAYHLKNQDLYQEAMSPEYPREPKRKI